ncbi:MAG: heme-binding protein [Candidatus Levybacteria bacterium]|nr:heme-binding protein [Candidatus Levybacteria bacterium]
MIKLITLEKAIKAAEKAVKTATELGIAVTVTIVDEHGTLICVNRMENAIPISPKFSYAKAYTSAVLGAASGDLAQYSGEGQPYFGTTSAFGGELMVIAGGLPVKKSGRIVGGVGVGGSMDVSQDVECAKAAVKVLEED